MAYYDVDDQNGHLMSFSIFKNLSFITSYILNIHSTLYFTNVYVFKQLYIQTLYNLLRAKLQIFAKVIDLTDISKHALPSLLTNE